MKTIINGVIYIAIFTAGLFVRGSISDASWPESIPRLFADIEEPERAPRFEPTSRAIVKEMLKIGGVTKNDIVYDLGSGDGRIVISAARETGARGVGVDIDPDLVRESRKNAERENVDSLVRFLQEDLFKTDISSASVVMLYLNPKTNLELRPRLLRELKPGTRIVSHSHDMGDWEPDKKSTVEDHDVYFWTVPADVSGSWKLNMSGDAGRASSVIFTQNYQNVEASIKAGQEEVPVTEARLNGKMLHFKFERQMAGIAGPSEFRGEVNGDLISGKFKSKHKAGRWTAQRIK